MCLGVLAREREEEEENGGIGGGGSLVLGVDLLIEEVLGQQVQLAVLLAYGVSADELELLQGELVELVLHLPDGRLLQLGGGLLGGRLLLRGLPQVGLLACGDRGGKNGSRNK